MTGNTSPPLLSRDMPGDASDEVALVAALRDGDEAAFIVLVERHHPSLLRLAMAYTPDRMLAEDLVQETWLALVRGIHRFEGRSSLKTWLCRVLTFQARRRAVLEGRVVPLMEAETPAIGADRFFPSGHRWAGHWRDRLPPWDDTPEGLLLARETLEQVESLIATLPQRQRAVIVLRDVDGMRAADVCEILGITDGSQRVLLHRARTHLREGLALYLQGTQDER